MNKHDVINYLKSHKLEFKERYGVIKMGLFGSYARETQQEQSDIDLAIEIESSKKSLGTFFAIKRTIENDLNKTVDLGIESSIKPIVKERILQEIIYV